MKFRKILMAALPLLFILEACQRPPRPCADEVMCQTHLHRYGVALDPDDWATRGQNGQVISTQKDGVVVTRTYAQGVLNGDVYYTFPFREVIQKREVYDTGALLQTFEYYPNGQPNKQVVYMSPRSYTVISWYENGAPRANESFVNGRLETGEYYTIDNQIESQLVDFNGTRIVRDSEGLLVSKEDINDGEMVQRTDYHSNGSPLAVIPFINNRKCGAVRTYLPGGEPATIETWKNDVQEGNTVFFEYGEKISDMPYVDGKRQGIERRYRDDGQAMVKEVSWNEDEMHGKCRSYVGGVLKEDWYFRGKLVNRPTFERLEAQ